MYSLIQLCFAIIALSAFARSTPVSVAPCASVHVIAARGFLEAPGPGIIGTLVGAVQAQSTQSVSTVAVDYPATSADYANSTAIGTTKLKALLTSQKASCPQQKLVLVGYQQGANIIGDAIAGGGDGGPLGPKTPPIDHSIIENVAAIIYFSDPRRVMDDPYNMGGPKRSGLLPRLPDQEYDSYTQTCIQSYCDVRDIYCGGSGITQSIDYIALFGTAATTFVLQKIGS